MNASTAALANNLSSSYLYEIGKGLMNLSLPHKQWTHEAHLAAALYLVRVRPNLDAHRLMPELIRRYNVVNGVANTDHSGFHATITEVYLRAITEFVQWLPDRTTPDWAFNFLLKTPIAERHYPLYFYSRELLMSAAARRAFVEPDLPPLTWIFFFGNRGEELAAKGEPLADDRNVSEDHPFEFQSSGRSCPTPHSNGQFRKRAGHFPEVVKGQLGA